MYTYTIFNNNDQRRNSNRRAGLQKSPTPFSIHSVVVLIIDWEIFLISFHFEIWLETAQMRKNTSPHPLQPVFHQPVSYIHSTHKEKRSLCFARRLWKMDIMCIHHTQSWNRRERKKYGYSYEMKKSKKENQNIWKGCTFGMVRTARKRES